MSYGFHFSLRKKSLFCTNCFTYLIKGKFLIIIARMRANQLLISTHIVSNSKILSLNKIQLYRVLQFSFPKLLKQLRRLN